MKITAEEISQKFQGQLVGDGGFVVEGVGDPLTAGPRTACFVYNENYLKTVGQSAAQFWVMAPQLFDSLEDDVKRQKTFILTENPYLLFTQLITHFFPAAKAKPFVHPQTWIDPSARVHPSAQIEAFVSIGPNSVVGPRVIIHAGCWIHEGVEVGEDSVLYGGVRVYSRSVIGKRNVLHSGAVIGADGFGFIPYQGRQVKIPQVGRTILGDDVEVGANTTIDRGALDDTIIGAGTKIDNQVQIGHNCKIGDHGIICAQSGLSGNTVAGHHLLMSGRVGTKGHLKIGDNVSIGGQSGVTKNISSGSTVKGYPAMPLQAFLKAQSLFVKLPEIYKRLLAVEKKLEGNKS